MGQDSSLELNELLLLRQRQITGTCKCCVSDSPPFLNEAIDMDAKIMYGIATLSIFWNTDDAYQILDLYHDKAYNNTLKKYPIRDLIRNMKKEELKERNVVKLCEARDKGVEILIKQQKQILCNNLENTQLFPGCIDDVIVEYCIMSFKYYKTFTLREIQLLLYEVYKAGYVNK
eukprot:211995_1